MRLIPTGSIADQILVRDGDDVVRLTFGTRPVKVDNIGKLPMAWVDPAAADSRTVVASGADALAEYQRALDEWRVLTGAALVGLVEETMTIAAEFAKNRYTLGVPISTLQGISHPLANIAITVAGGRNLARRAAWFLDNEPDERPELAPSAFVFMAEEASKAATMAVQVQGGLGVSAEAAATAYLVRARGWSLAGGDPGASAKYIAEIVAARESGGAKSMDFSRVELSDEDEAFLRRVPRFPARARHRRRLPPRPRDRRQLRRGRASGARRSRIPGARMEAGVRGRIQPGAERASGSWRSAGRMCRG